LHRYRLNHLLAMERVRTRLATDLHDDLGAGLAEIAILSEVAKRQERPRTIELLDGIAGRARSLRESMTDIVWTVDPHAIVWPTRFCGCAKSRSRCSKAKSGA
ncbi:MAG TPA: histidine kinase, partial [Bryobacteraceae bacterium]|nr:histidine kinase [Bryobacteraceae bacterium]